MRAIEARALRSTAGAIALSSVVVLAACSGPAPAPRRSADVAAEGLKAFDRGDWIGAAWMLREAVARDPSSLKLHYSLALADTYVELREEAIREFQWVLGNAPAGSPEAVTARKWLAQAGALTGAVPAAATSAVKRTPGNRTRARDDGPEQP